MATEWKSKGNAMLAKLVEKQGLRLVDVAEIVNSELVRLKEPTLTPMQINHLTRNRRGLSAIGTAVAIERALGIPVEAWVTRRKAS
jgi:plasmid maintenance system antidote protein VapI